MNLLYCCKCILSVNAFLLCYMKGRGRTTTKKTIKDQLSDEQCLVLGGRRISDFVEGFEGASLQSLT